MFAVERFGPAVGLIWWKDLGDFVISAIGIKFLESMEPLSDDFFGLFSFPNGN